MDPQTKSKAISAKTRRLADLKQAEIAKLNTAAAFGSTFYDQEIARMKDPADMTESERESMRKAADEVIEAVADEVLEQAPSEKADNALTIRNPVPPSLTPPRIKLPRGSDELYNAILQALGSDQDIKEALLTEGSQESIKFLSLMLDPNRSSLSITRKASMCGMTLKRLRDLLTQYKMMKANGNIIARLPEFANSLHTDASTKVRECGLCIGKGTIEDRVRTGEIDDDGKAVYDLQERVCPRCDGGGKETHAGDKDARATIANTVGWTGKQATMAVNVNIGGVESIIKDVDRMKTINVKPVKS